MRTGKDDEGLNFRNGKMKRRGRFWMMFRREDQQDVVTNWIGVGKKERKKGCIPGFGECAKGRKEGGKKGESSSESWFTLWNLDFFH